MKNILIIALSLLLMPLSAYASAEDKEIIKFCEEASTKMSMAQAYNQMRKPISEAIKMYPKSVWKMVEYAYAWEVKDTKKGKSEAVSAFYNEVFMDCVYAMERENAQE